LYDDALNLCTPDDVLNVRIQTLGVIEVSDRSICPHESELIVSSIPSTSIWPVMKSIGLYTTLVVRYVKPGQLEFEPDLTDPGP
jgi:hypothetical protein